MKSSNDFINGWTIRERDDGAGFSIVDGHGGNYGPYATKAAAIAAALKLPPPVNMALVNEVKRRTPR